MIAVYVPPERTPLTFDEAAECFRWALSTPGAPISDEGLALALAKSALETGRWQKMWNWSFGNVKCPETQEGMFTAYIANEIINGRTRWFIPEGEVSRQGGPIISQIWEVPPAHPQTRFRAFANQWDGVDQYVTFLQRPKWAKAYAALLGGTATAYVHELKLAGYFTAPEDQYVRGVASLQIEFLKRLRGNRVAEDTLHPDLMAEVERLQRLWFATVLFEDESPVVA